MTLRVVRTAAMALVLAWGAADVAWAGAWQLYASVLGLSFGGLMLLSPGIAMLVARRSRSLSVDGAVGVLACFWAWVAYRAWQGHSQPQRSTAALEVLFLPVCQLFSLTIIGMVHGIAGSRRAA